MGGRECVWEMATVAAIVRVSFFFLIEYTGWSASDLFNLWFQFFLTLIEQLKTTDFGKLRKVVLNFNTFAVTSCDRNDIDQVVKEVSYIQLNTFKLKYQTSVGMCF